MSFPPYFFRHWFSWNIFWLKRLCVYVRRGDRMWGESKLRWTKNGTKGVHFCIVFGVIKIWITINMSTKNHFFARTISCPPFLIHNWMFWWKKIPSNSNFWHSQVSTQAKISSLKNPRIKIDLLHKPIILYNEFKHYILTLVGSAKKNENQNKSIQNECLFNFALRNVALIDFLLIFFHY